MQKQRMTRSTGNSSPYMELKEWGGLTCRQPNCKDTWLFWQL